MSAKARFSSALVPALIILSGCTPSVEPVLNGGNSGVSVSITSSSSSTATPETRQGSTTSPRKTVPDRIDLDVPFSSQAPFAVWDELHEETCEEMSLIMAMHYVRGDRGNLTPAAAEDELQKLVSWMTERGYSYDVTIAELAQVAREYYGLHARIRDDVSEESIKEELAAGRPVIIPAAGRMLGNPYFSGEGPWYHMLVITGYREGLFGTAFITNDPGTKRGDGYEYKADVVLNAIHDWTGVKEEIAQGKKTMLIVTLQD